MSKVGAFFKDLVIIVGSAIVLTIIVKAFIIDSRIIPSGSMYATVHENDRIMVTKFTYRFHDIARGDIIVFAPPPDIDEKLDLLKRVIGLPGDKIEIKNGTVFVNDVALAEPYIFEKPNYEFGPVLVPEGKILVLGDNRNNSNDSHLWPHTFADISAVKGKAQFCYWPIERAGSLYNLDR